MNISIIAMMLLILAMIGLWRKHVLIAVAGVIAYFLVGSSPSALRAGIMGIMLLWAKTGRFKRVEAGTPRFYIALIRRLFNIDSSFRFWP